LFTLPLASIRGERYSGETDVVDCAETFDVGTFTWTNLSWTKEGAIIYAAIEGVVGIPDLRNCRDVTQDLTDEGDDCKDGEDRPEF
jgi:hypothetical protein